MEDWFDARELDLLKLQNEINIASLENDEMTKKLKEVGHLQQELVHIRELLRSTKQPKSASTSFNKEHVSGKHNFSLNLPLQIDSRHKEKIQEIIYEKPKSARTLPKTDRVNVHSRNQSLQSRKNSRKSSGSSKRGKSESSEPFKNLSKVLRKDEPFFKPVKKDFNIYLSQDDYRARNLSTSPKIVSERGSRDFGYGKKPPKIKETSISQRSLYAPLSARDYQNQSSTSEYEDKFTARSITKDSIRLRSTPRKIDVLEEEEELIRSGRLGSMKRDELVAVYKKLFEKTKEIRDLLTDFTETNNRLKLNQENLEKEKEKILEENDNLKQKISELAEDLTIKENQMMRTESETQKKIAEMELERDMLKRQMNELEAQIDTLKDKFNDPFIREHEVSFHEIN